MDWNLPRISIGSCGIISTADILLPLALFDVIVAPVGAGRDTEEEGGSHVAPHATAYVRKRQR